jgi:nitrogen fixation protein FixH
MKSQTLWPLAVVAALAFTIAANVALFVVAGDSRHIGVEPDYYGKAVAWDSTMARRDESLALGWRLDAAIAPADGGATVRVSLNDRNGDPLPGAIVRLEAIHNLDPDGRLEARLPGVAPGIYQSVVPLRHRGLWELRFDVVRGTDRFSTSLRRDLAGGR